MVRSLGCGTPRFTEVTVTLPLLPTLDELLHPETQPEAIRQRALACSDPLDPIHLCNMTWRQPAGHVEHRVLPSALNTLALM